MIQKKVNIKIIRENEVGIPKGTILKARYVEWLMLKRYQILTDGEYLGEYISLLEAVEV